MSKHILIVDDDKDDQQIFCDVIQDINPHFVCDTANNGLEALQHIEIREPYDMVFMDINMPLMNGFECLKRMKELQNYRHVPVVIMSTSKSEFDYKKSIELGAYQFLPKPTDFATFQANIKSIVNTLKAS